MNISSRIMTMLTILLLSSTLFVNLANAYSGYVGEKIYLPAPTVLGTLGATVWESSDNSLVSVDANGVAQIKKYFSGELTITCMYNYSYYSGGKTHYVTNQFASYSITSKSSTITLNKTEITMEAGDEVELTYTNSSGYELPFSEWLTSNENVAKMYGGNAFVATNKIVGEDGVIVVGVGEGQCTISCDGNSGDNVKTCKVTVVDNRWVKSDVESGAVKKGTKVTLTCTKQGATIYYTTDGSEPSKVSTQYISPIEINSDMTLKAKAYMGSEESKTSKWNYVVSSHLVGEIFRAKTIEGVEVRYKVTSTGSGIACMVIGGYSMRAIDKNYSGHLTIPEYADDILVTGIDEGAFSECKLTSVTLPEYSDLFLAHTFKIYKEAFKYSNIESLTIPPKNRVYIGEEAFSNCRSLETISFNHIGIEKISHKAFYACTNIKTINSNLASPPKLPTDCFDEKVYNNAVLYIPQGKYDIYKSSDWKIFKNIVEKGSQQQLFLTASPSGGEVEKGTVVTLSADVSGAEIYYTLDGSTPSNSSKYYSSAIIINENCTLKAIAYKEGYYSSDVLTEYYTVSSQVNPTPTPTPDGPIEINATNFPDENFRNYLLETGFGKDNVITSDEISSIANLYLNSKNINSLKGIEYFTSLTCLDCNNNQLTSLDISKNTALTELHCGSNQLTSLDVSRNTALTELYCHSNQLTSLDVSNNMALTNLGCGSNQLTSLDVSRNTALTNLGCSSNQLTSLDVSNNMALTNLGCSSNQLTSLNVSWNKELEYISCYGNCIKEAAMDNLINSLPNNSTVKEHKIYIVEFGTYSNDNVCTKNQVAAMIAKGWTVLEWLAGEYAGSDPTEINSDSIEINTTNFPDVNFRNYLLEQDYGKDGVITSDEISSIANLYLNSKNINSLKGIEYFTSLTCLDCNNNQLTSLDISKNTALTELYCDSNQLTSLDVSRNTALTELWCYNNQLTSLDVSNNTALTELWCGSNQLISLDFSRNTALTELYCDSNQLTTLDVSKNTELTELYCSNNQLTSLDVSNNTALTELWCGSNQLISLDFSRNTALTNLWCNSNQLTSLDVSNNMALTNLFCTSNLLTSLDVSWNTALTYLACGSNQLTSLDVSRNTALTELYCDSNQLTTLDVSKNTALTNMDCGSNQLSSLDVSWNKELEYISCYGNFIKEADMDNLINSLPNNITGKEHNIYIVDGTYNEGNVCTKNQVAAMITKGWTVLDWEGKEYAGSDPTGINGILIDLEKDAPIFDLSGKLLTKTRKGINIIGGKKVVIK